MEFNLNTFLPLCSTPLLQSRNFTKGSRVLLDSQFPEKFAENVAKTNAALQSQKSTRDIFQKEWYHYSSIALAGLTPIALILSPSALNLPVDLALGVAIPFHTQLGLTLVVDDYVHGSLNSVAKILVWVISIVMALGFLYLNVSGIGITESVKELWRKDNKYLKR